MRTTFFKAFNLLLVSFGLWAYNARACDVFFDFNAGDPTLLAMPPYDQFGKAHWVDNLDGTGYLSITDAGNGQVSVIVFHDCDNGKIIGHFAIDLDVRLGGPSGDVTHADGFGVQTRWAPADGMSINYARAEDPIFVLAGKNGNNYGFACTPAGECGGYEAEEGTTTGLAVCLDEWDSGPGDVIGITIRLDGTIIANYGFPKLNGDSTDLTSLQTYDGYVDGPNPGVGQFVPLHAEVTSDGHVIVRYKLNPDGTPHEVTPAGGLPTTFAASPAALVIGGRTGGANSNDHVDNIHIVTAVSVRPIWGPIINITPIQITWQIFDSPTVSFDPTLPLAITLDGNPVTSDAGSVVKNGLTTSGTISFPPSNPLASGSTHTLAGAWTSSDGGHDSGSHKFTVTPYIPVPASYAAGTHVNPATDTQGFQVRIHQLPIARFGYPGGDPNSNRSMEHELADGYIDPTTGLAYVNQADLTTIPPDLLPDVYYTDIQQPGNPVINYGAGSEGHFPLDNKIPGEPSLNVIVHNNTDWDAMDIEAFLQLKVGLYRFGVNSDDGFLFKFGAGRGDVYGTQVGRFNTGRAAADTTFDVFIAADGFYPIRCDWENGTGGANIEIYSVNIADGSRHLVNDPTDPQAVLAFRTGYAQAYVKSILPVVGDLDAHWDRGVVVKLMDDAPSTVTQASISMTLDGTTYPNGDPKLHIDHTAPPLTMVSLDGPAGGFPPGSSHTGTISFNGNTQSFNFSATWLIPGIFVIEAEDFDSTDPATGITQHNPGAGTPGTDTDYNPVLLPYLGGAFVGLGAEPLVDYNNNDDKNESPQYRGPLMPHVNINQQFNPPNFLTDHPGLYNRGAYDVTTSYKLGWTDSADWEDYTRDFGPTPNVFKVVIALSSGAGPPNVHATLYEVTAGQGTTSQTLNNLGTFSGNAHIQDETAGNWGLNAILPLKDSLGNDAVVRYSGVHTLRMYDDNGDYDWYAFVPVVAPARIVGATLPLAGDMVSRNMPIVATLADLSTTVVLTSLHLVVNGVDQITHATVAHNATTGLTQINYIPAFPAPTPVTYTLSFTDSAGATVSTTVSYMTDPRGAGDFVIEIEDFNFGSGQHLAISDVMPYYGGAYQDDTNTCLPEVLGIDYNNDDTGNESNQYRLCESGPNANINGSPGGRNNHRSGWDVTTNYKIGWVGPPDWCTYTRVFPPGNYKVYAALSFGDSGAHQCHGRLQLVSDPTVTNTTLTDLGTFDAHGTANLGGWGANTLVPMRTPAGCVAVVHLAGTTSLRYNADSGDSDFLTFVPAVQLTGPAGTITSIKYNGDGTVTLTWTGAGELDVADNITGPWMTIPGATSPLTVPADRPHRFARLVVCLDEQESWPTVP